MKPYDLVIIGGGPAGLAAAQAAYDAGIRNLLLLERDTELGGILNQCLHRGFGSHTFGQELTGPEYAQRCVQQINDRGISYKLNTMVLDIRPDKTVVAVNKEDGLLEIPAKAIILAMGCRERPRGALNTPGFRPAGVYTAGMAQRMVNKEGVLPGHDVVILGSGDIGLITARRMTQAGAKVHVVVELMPYSGGLKRNLEQCLDAYGIPLKLSHTVVDIHGKRRLERVTIAQVDAHNKPIPGTEEDYPCDTLLLSVGLLPENELSRKAGVELSGVTNGPVVNQRLETNLPGVFACGNVLHVHDLVDFVSQEAAAAGRAAADFIRALPPIEPTAPQGDLGISYHARSIPILADGGVRYTVPQRLLLGNGPATPVTLRFRVSAIFHDKFISVYADSQRIYHKQHPTLAPGEMQTVVLEPNALNCSLDQITVTLEDQ